MKKIKSTFIFVLMPFDSSFDDMYQLGIKETIKEIDSDIIVQRLDEQMFTEGMLSRIYSQIEKADLIIADMTGKNPNVFYEVGFAHAKEKLTLLITKEANDIPFDLKHYRHIVYGQAIGDLKKQLKTNVHWALTEIENKKNLPLDIDLKVTGDLDKNDFSAKANIEMKIDFTNNSKDKTVAIDALYLYTQKGWAYKQNGVPCPQANSDLSNYNIKHQIIPQIMKITNGNWSQISLVGQRTLASVLAGDELKEKYLLQGVVTMRIVSGKDSFDFEKDLTLTVEEFSF